MAAETRDMTFKRALGCFHAGDIAQAEGLCRDLVGRNRKDHRAASLLGQIATITSRHDEAIDLLGTCVKRVPREITYHVLLAQALATCGRFQDAASRFDKALRLQGDHAPSLAGKASVLGRLKEWKRARALLEPFVEAGTEDANIALAFARIAVHDGDFAKAVEIASRHLDDEIRDEQRRSLWFAIGIAHERAAAYDEAFEAYTQGKRTRMGSFDPALASRMHDRVINLFSRELADGLPRASEPSPLPVFVVGMPRSGSTLIEQIIDAHPDAHGAGEVLDLSRLLATLSATIGSTLDYPECIGDLDRQDVDDLALAYLEQIRGYAPTAARICNKDLSLYGHLGLMAAVFPAGHVIHARRNPLDTCLSCYVQDFLPGSHEYTADLRALGMAYNDYLALMAHWRTLDLPMLEVDYEDLVVNQEAVSRRIIEFCDLPWDDRCLSFYETKRAVITMSHDQVNRPIYNSSVDRHRLFARHLGPLQEVLEKGERG